ncbi:MAG: hypothetical protein ACI8V7_000495 [Candidatus Paceibacteria bacterium]|jgi:hypothetical protein
MNTPLDENGYPKKPTSIFISIKRIYFPHKDVFERCLEGSLERVGIPVRSLGSWETISGHVTKITKFPDGTVIHYPQDLYNSPLKWPDAILWVPNKGTIGILN